jgi:hypothetical protein
MVAQLARSGMEAGNCAGMAASARGYMPPGTLMLERPSRPGEFR